MFLAAIPPAPEAAFCSRCLELEGMGSADVRLPCSVEGCASAPEFILEEQSGAEGPFVLCGRHFDQYPGIIDRVFRLPPDDEGGREHVADLGVPPWGLGDHWDRRQVSTNGGTHENDQ